jgi:hypothetical protein
LVFTHEVTHETVGGDHALVAGTISSVSGADSFTINVQIQASDGLNIVEDMGSNGSVVRVGVVDTNWRCKGTLKEYSNVPGGCNIVTAAPLSPWPAVGDLVYIESRSIMSPEAGVGQEFCSKWLHMLRNNTLSPLP